LTSISRSKVAEWRGLLLAAVSPVVAAGCGYPDFEFERETPIGDAAVPVQVPCTVNDTLCNVGQVCCFANSASEQDYCGTKDSCGTNYSEFDCNAGDDCPGAFCCANVNPQASCGVNFIACKATCTASDERVVCNMLESCGSQETCAPLTYPGYGFCVPTTSP
jgi:hypothetical protein